MSNQKTTNKMESLLAKRAALDARIDRLKQRVTATDRKARGRALLLLGVAFEKQIQAQPGSAHIVRRIILAHLKEREQIAVISYLFPPMPNSAESENANPQTG
jgi:histidinol-phosphate/aromatic aminotransferase/cobyric acid decarboxylase-like protein